MSVHREAAEAVCVRPAVLELRTEALQPNERRIVLLLLYETVQRHETE